MASSDHLKPGQKGEIKVTVDLKGKFGNIHKTVRVTTNDPRMPVTTLMLKMKVNDLIHAKKYAAGEIFRGSCRGCHIERGRLQRGFGLFVSDCIMCHNAGKSALPASAMRTKSREQIERSIREGVDHTSMPGWDAKHGGPLTDEQIRGLVNVLKPVSRRRGRRPEAGHRSVSQ